MSSSPQFDTVVIGGGQGGALARMLCEGGQRVAIIECDHFGGTCTNYGCTPSKAFQASAKRAHDARTAGPLGVHITEVIVNFREVVARAQSIVTDFRDEVADRLEHLPTITRFDGTGRFAGPREGGLWTIEVETREGTQRIQTPHVVLATGAKPLIPDLEGLADTPYLTYKTLWTLDALPDHLVVMGGGYIGCEVAQMFRRFGAQVTLLQKGPQLLTKEDPDVAEAVADILREDDVDVRLGTACVRVAGEGDTSQGDTAKGQGVTLHLEREGREETLRASHLLVAVGQEPNTKPLQLDKAGIETDDKGALRINDSLEAAPGVWGLGDCKGGPQFTHVAFDDARRIAHHLLHSEPIVISDRVVPSVVFIDPQLGRVGLSEAEAQKTGVAYRVAQVPVCDTARGIESGEDKGFLKILVGEDDQVLGAALLARDGGELIGIIQTAIAGKLSYRALFDMLWAHPTQSEAFYRVLKSISMPESAKMRQKSS